MKEIHILLLVGTICISACSTTSKPTLSDSMTFTPGWPALKQSVKQAASSPAVWGNLLAAAALQIGNLDQQLSDQLREHNPLFGSQQNAANRSDDFRDLTEMAYVSTALLLPESSSDTDHAGTWLSAKVKLLGAEWITVKIARSMTSSLKSLADRERPNDLNDRSFPSGHATSASAQAQMASLNINHLALEKETQQVLYYSLDGLTALTAWARVEAGMHYPSDVLAGWAVGYFIAQLGNTFIDPKQQVSIMPQQVSAGAGIQLVFRY